MRASYRVRGAVRPGATRALAVTRFGFHPGELRMSPRRLVRTSLLALLLGCSRDDASDPGATRKDAGPAVTFPTTGTALPCDVDAVFERHCRKCHTNPPESGAPMPLLFYENLHAPARSDPSKKVYELVGQRIHDDEHPMPQPPNARLDEATAKVLGDWIAAGAPAGDDAGACTNDGGAPIDAGPPIPTTCAITALGPASRWAMPTTVGDIDVCYGVEVTALKKRHVVAIAPKVDTKTIVHHVVLYRADSAVSGVPAACDPIASRDWRVLYGWVPGSGNLVLPDAAGFPEEGAVHYVVQIHYSNVNYVPDLTDASGVELCTTEQLRPNDADVVSFGTRAFSVPAHGALDLTCRYAFPAGAGELHAFSAFPHMHKYGKSIATVKLGVDGGPPTELGGQGTWNTRNQYSIPIAATLLPGDPIETRCAWSNPSDQNAPVGEGVGEEMCASFTAYWPKVTVPAWSWLAPSEQATCGKTP
jgi:hypothetical protein